MEGEVGRVQCPDIDCVKAGREATEEEVRRIVTEEELVRWRWLREKRMLDKGQFPFLRLSDSVLRRL
jgi:E3 ubiquitin-protein ligase RNF14